MKCVVKSIASFVNAKSSVNISDEELRRIRLTKQLSLLSTLIMMLFFTISALTENYFKLKLQLSVLVYIPTACYIFNRLGLHLLARFSLIIAACLAVSLDSLMGGSSEYHQIFFIVIALGIGLIFEPSNWKAMIPALVIPFCSWTTLEISDFQLLAGEFPPQSNDQFTRHLNTFLTYVVASGLAWKFAHTAQRSETLARQTSKMAALGEMAAGMGHEINNPLAIISASIEVTRRKIADNTVSSDDITKMLDRVYSATHRVARIVDSLKKFSHSTNFDQLSDTSIQQLVETALDLCQHRIHIGEIEIQQISAENVAIRCRESETIQVLVNLLNNSFDAIEHLTERWIKISWATGETSVEIAIVDSGNGIPKPDAEKIMQPFFTTKEIGHGTGLGLSVSTGLIRGHGGTLELDQSSRNTRFVIKLPNSMLIANEAKSSRVA